MTRVFLNSNLATFIAFSINLTDEKTSPTFLGLISTYGVVAAVRPEKRD